MDMLDLTTIAACSGIVIVSAAVVYLTSVLGIKEQTYEEAIEEQRRRNGLNELITTGKSEKHKKEKKEKTKKSNKKLKEKSVDETPAEPKPIRIPHLTQDTHNRKHHERVGFKPEPEVVMLNDHDNDHDNHQQLFNDIEGSRKSSVSSTSERIPKPILINKLDTIDLSPQRERHTQRNSFDLLHPKDDFELIKSRELKKITDSNVNVNAEPNMTIIEEQSHVIVSPQKEVAVYDVIKEETKVNTDANERSAEISSDVMSHQKKGKKWKQNQTASNGNALELSTKKIADFVKTAPLTNEEIQMMTDILLNKQGDGSTEWTKKNDPIAMLKKQLQEKELALDAETKNLKASQLKNKELRDELDNERTRLTKLKENANKLQTDNYSLHSRVQQISDQYRGDSNNLQNQVKQIQGKLNEERTIVLRLQDENSRLQQHLQQLQGDQHLKHEVEQLRSERQQYDRKLTSLQQSNDELHRKVQQYETHIKSLSDSRQKEELTFQQRMSDMTKDMQKIESQNAMLLEELNQSNNRFRILEDESKDLKNRCEDIESSKNNEMKQLAHELSELSKEKVQLECALADANHREQQNGELSQEDRERNNRLNEELRNARDELKITKNDLEIQRQRFDDLMLQNKKAAETLDETIKQNKDVVESAVRAAEESYQNKHQSEVNELNTIKNEKDALRNTIADFQAEQLKYNDERRQIKEILMRVLPNLSSYGENWVNHIEQSCEESLLSKKVDNNDDNAFKELESHLHSEKEKNRILESEALQYKATLNQTGTLLTNLQDKAQSQEREWQLKQLEYETKISDLSYDNEKLNEQKRTLENSILEIQGLRENIAEMELKLKELHEKLQGEENEKKQWEAKYDEVRHRKASKDAIGLRNQLNDRTKDLELFEKDKSEIEQIKSENEQMKVQLEKEKRTSKDLSTQNVRLNSLVKIGQESLKQEQDRVKELESQLNLKNGSIGPSPNCSSNNGPSEPPINNSSVTIGDSSEHLSSNTNQSLSLPTNIKSHKTKRRGASVKK